MTGHRMADWCPPSGTDRDGERRFLAVSDTGVFAGLVTIGLTEWNDRATFLLDQGAMRVPNQIRGRLGPNGRS